MMLKGEPPKFELPSKIEMLLASLAQYFSAKNKPTLAKLIVNARYRIKEQWEYDNWDGGTYGHALFLQLPSALYYATVDNADECASDIREAINKLKGVQGEYVAIVFLELLAEDAASDWRERSGFLVNSDAATRPADDDRTARLWTPGYFKLFLSHKAEYKRETAAFKDCMATYGVSCFVAHEDIEPTAEWQAEIERALLSMDALAALLTPNFSDSHWTDQEVGAAVGRRVQVISIRLGKDPYGFIGKYQGVPGHGLKSTDLAKKVYELLWNLPHLKAKLVESLVTRFKTAGSFEHANNLMEYVERLDTLSPHLIDQLDLAYQSNRQVRNAWKVEDRLPTVLRRLRGHA